MRVLPARKGGGEVAPKSAPAGSGLRLLALGVFVLLLAFGFLLLFVPDLADDLDERTGGGAETSAEAVTVTEAERTTESETRSRTRSASERRAGGGGDRAAAGSPDRSTARGSRRQSTRTSTETSTTTTESAAPDPGVLERTLGVPAVVVLTRTTLVALLAALVAWALTRLGPRPASEGVVGDPVTPPSPDPPAGASTESSTAVLSSSVPPRTSVITVDDAEAARASVVDGIPLLREVFAARGEPSVDNVLPDMRAGVQLTETLSKEQPLPVSLFARDAALALAAFRTEIEQRLRRLARDEDLQCAPSLDAILRNLTEEGLFEPAAAEGFRNLLRLAQRALHGGAIDPAMVGWVTERGVPLLLSLDLMLPS